MLRWRCIRAAIHFASRHRHIFCRLDLGSLIHHYRAMRRHSDSRTLTEKAKECADQQSQLEKPLHDALFIGIFSSIVNVDVDRR